MLGRRLREGYDIGAATALDDPANMTMFDRVALERDERFNTRISSYLGWERAARKLIPTPRQAAQFDLTQMVRRAAPRRRQTPSTICCGGCSVCRRRRPLANASWSS